MLIAIASDHRGFELKEKVKEHLRTKGYTVSDFGCHGRESVNYVEYALAVALSIRKGDHQRGILICNDGVGMSIVANKVPGIRCAVCPNQYYAQISREHNDSNILAFGCIQSEIEAREIVDIWLDTAFEGGRHIERMKTLTDFEKKLLSGDLSHE